MLLVKKMPEREAIESFLKYSPETDLIAIEALITLLHVTSSVFSAINTHFARNNISQGRFHVLVMLAKAKTEAKEKGSKHSPQVTPANIADFLNVTRATITGLLDKLESDDLIIRKACKKDRRKQMIFLTSKADKYLAKFFPEHIKRTGALMSKLSNKECKTLMKLLGKVAASVPLVEEP